MPRTKPYKTKIHCEVCGRFIRSGIPLDSPEKALCSFCIEKLQKQRADEKEAQKRLKTQLKKCESCGKATVLMPHTKVCERCYFLAKFPTAKVTKLRFDFEKHRNTKTRGVKE